ncbi:MAG: IS3 family transposase [Planctomycetota bacterium]
MVDYVNKWGAKTNFKAKELITMIGVSKSTYHHWKGRYGKPNEHNGKVPRDWWLTPDEKKAIVDYYDQHPLEGYRRLTYMMLDADVVAASPATVYRILKEAGRMGKRSTKASRKGKGFHQPTEAHQHWHIDISYINAGGTFYYLITVMDGFSRVIVHHDLRESMKEFDVEVVLQGAREKHPDATPRIISDNGPQFLAGDFKSFIRQSGMTHVRTSPYYPQSNGKLERWHSSLKQECVRPSAPRDGDEARQKIAAYVEHYNTERLDSAIGYITPADRMAGKTEEIQQARDRKLETARQRRKAEAKARRLVAVPAD